MSDNTLGNGFFTGMRISATGLTAERERMDVIAENLEDLRRLAIIVTAFYDLLTNVATGLVYGQMRTWLLAGIPFALWHIGYNIALFATLGDPLSAVSARYSERLSA